MSALRCSEPELAPNGDTGLTKRMRVKVFLLAISLQCLHEQLPLVAMGKIDDFPLCRCHANAASGSVSNRRLQSSGICFCPSAHHRQRITWQMLRLDMLNSEKMPDRCIL